MIKISFGIKNMEQLFSDPNAEWKFTRNQPEIVKLIKCDPEGYCFESKWGMKQKIRVTLHTYNKKNSTIEGSFKVIDGGLYGKIKFQLNSKNEFAGKPTNLIVDQIWTLCKGK